MVLTPSVKYICNKAFDCELDKISHFKLHPELKPFVGEKYGSKLSEGKNGILLIGESHYIKDGLTAESFSKWYEATTEEIINSFPPEYQEANPDIKNWFDTRHVICDNYLNGHQYRSKTIFSNPAKVLCKICESDGGLLCPAKEQEAFTYFSFMNFFQRPEVCEGKSFIASKTDIFKANEILKDVIQVLRPSKVIFVSKHAFSSSDSESMSRELKMEINYTVHPTSAWWNRSEGKYGSKKFENLVSPIFKNT